MSRQIIEASLVSSDMKKLKSLMNVKGLFILIFVSGLFTGSSDGKEDFEVKSVYDNIQRSYVFITVSFQCNLKEAKEAQLVIYNLMKKGKEKTVAKGVFILTDLEKDRYNNQYMIRAGYVEKYGRPYDYRVEIWYKDRLVSSKTKPKAKEKWWEAKTVDIIELGDEELRKILRRYED